MRARALSLLLVLPLAGCATGGSPRAESTPPSPAPQPRVTHTVVTTSTPLPLPTIENEVVHFRTSDGRVGCDLEPAYVLCNAKSHTYTPPRKPSDCLYVWGKAVEMAVGTPGSFFCGHGEDYTGSKRVLPPGQALRVGLVTCRALSSGVECFGQGHGFRYSPSSYRLY
jgi:hypothetical protein